jgi:predicted  nucleic acid-binding Zn-ribbon protein
LSSVRRLYQLQEIDNAIRDNKKAVKNIEAQLQDDHTLVEAKAKLGREEKSLSDLRHKEKQLDWDIEELSGKIKEVEKQLFGGSVKNPKDLDSLNHECEHFKQRRSGMEDDLLELMSDAEQQQSAYDSAKQQAEKIEKEWLENNGHLVEDRDRLNAEAVELAAKREKAASQIDEPSLKIYERLRKSKGGEAVARVEQGMCKGCRINLPTHTLQKVRGGQQIVYCTNCNRILYIA